MPSFLRFLFENPILLIIAGAWLVGTIGNAAKAAKAARERSARRAPSPPSPPASREPRRAEPARSAPARPPQRTPDEVAAEMRRILGMDVETIPVEHERNPVAIRPKHRDVVEAERPPAPAVPTTQDRRLEMHVDPHVGEGIKHRLAPQSGRVGGAHMGTLGGRVHERTVRRAAGSRLVDLTDLKSAFVTNEILGAPLALRGPNEIRGA